MPYSSYAKAVKAPHSRVFRRASIKRMQTDGTYESTWYDITEHVMRWGSYSKSLDPARFNKIAFNSANIVLDNTKGLFDDESNASSIWSGYASRQRTLIQIEAGYESRTKQSTGIWERVEFGSSYWDEALFDDGTFDSDGSIIFKGMIYGDIFINDQQTVSLPLVPLLEVFRQYPARNLYGYTSTGSTAKEFLTSVWDHQDGSGNYIFRPFFDNTTTYWQVTSSATNYTNLNTSTATDVIDASVWDIIEKLAQSENYVSYVDATGVFYFNSREANTSSSQFTFNGPGFITDDTYGVTIKNVSSFGPKTSAYYSRVSLKWSEANTSTSYQVYESTVEVSGSNNAWRYGHRTYDLTNLWIPDVSTAQTIAQNIFNYVSSINNQIEFTTPLITTVDLLDYVTVKYDSQGVNSQSLWDINDWGSDNSTVEANALYFSDDEGSGLILDNQEMVCLSVSINLDNLENRFILRET